MRIFIGAFSSALPGCRRLSSPLRSLAAAHAALGAWLRASYLGACVGWAGGTAGWSLIAPRSWSRPLGKPSVIRNRRLPTPSASGASSRLARRLPATVPHRPAPRALADAPARNRLRQRAGMLLLVWKGRQLCSNFCNGQGIRHPIYPTRPMRLSAVTSNPASTPLIRLHLGSRIVALALPDCTPAPRSERP